MMHRSSRDLVARFSLWPNRQWPLRSPHDCGSHEHDTAWMAVRKVYQSYKTKSKQKQR